MLDNFIFYNQLMTRKTVLFLALMGMTTLGYAQNTALISREKLFTLLKGYSGKQAASDTLRVQLSKEVQQQQAGLQKKYQDLIQPYTPKQDETAEALQARMSKIDQEKFRLLVEEQKLQDTRIKSFNSQLDELYARDLKPYIIQVEAALQQYARKNKIDMVWYLEDVAKALPYYNKEKDITAAIAEAVNQAMLKK